MKISKRLLLFGALVIIMFTVSQLMNKRTLNKRTKYLESFNLTLTGRVYDKDSLEKNGGIVRLKLSDISIYNYDTRSESNPYFCVVKGNKAELVTIFIDRFEIGDSVIVNGKSDSLFIYKNHNDLKVKFSIGQLIIDTGPLATTVKWKHEL